MTDDLLERDAQREAIDIALRDTRHGDGGVLVIEAAAGLGKSRLLHELRGSAAVTMRVLTARAGELEQSFAFGVVRQLFEAVVRDPELGPLATEGAAAAARDVFEERPGDGDGAGAASFAILHGLHWLTLNLGEQQPLVLAIDDLHWCDSSSLRFLGYLARRLEGTHVLLAATTRPVTRSGVDATLLGDIVAGPTTRHLDLHELSRTSAAQLLAAQFGRDVDGAFADACFDATDGNPLMLRQLARSLQSEGLEPVAASAANVRRAAHRALSRTVLARVGRQSEAAIALARAVAVIGENATVPLVCALTGLDDRTITAAWAELAQSEILRREPLAFVHALVRDAVYFDLPLPEREALHRRAATVLHAQGAAPERVASQLALSPPAGEAWAVDLLIDAGAAALRRGAPEAAVRHFQRASEEPPAPERERKVLGRLAEATFDVDATAACELFERLIADEPDPERRSQLQAGRVQALALTDRWDEAAAVCAEEIARLGNDQEQARAILQTVRAVVGMFGADVPDAFEELSRHRHLEPGAGLGERLRAGEAALLWMFDGGPAAECAALALQGAGKDPSVLRDHTLIAAATLYVLALADDDAGLDLWLRARADAHRSGSVVLHLTIDLWLGFTQWRRGDLAEALVSLDDAYELGQRWRQGREPLRYNRATAALARLDAHGDAAGARMALEPSTPDPGQGSLGSLLWWHAHAWTLLAEGRNDEALAASQTLETLGHWVKTPIGMDWWRVRATALHRLGRTDEALAEAERSLTLSNGWGSPGSVGPALRTRGELRGTDGLDDLRRSVEVLDGSAARFELARSLTALGGALRRAGQPSAAREPLERAHELARACGSPALAEAVRTELAASGVRRVPGEAGGPAALTPSERRVADLAAAGRTNREIAQELFVTPKTVEVHLSASYRKLGIASRHALASALAEA